MKTWITAALLGLVWATQGAAQPRSVLPDYTDPAELKSLLEIIIPELHSVIECNDPPVLRVEGTFPGLGQAQELLDTLQEPPNSLVFHCRVLRMPGSVLKALKGQELAAPEGVELKLLDLTDLYTQANLNFTLTIEDERQATGVLIAGVRGPNRLLLGERIRLELSGAMKNESVVRCRFHFPGGSQELTTSAPVRIQQTLVARGLIDPIDPNATSERVILIRPGSYQP